MITHHWTEAIEAYLAHQRAAGAPLTTCTTRRQHLQHMARRIELDPWDISGAQLVNWAGAQTWGRETRRGRRTTFRSFWAWAVASGHTTTNPATDLPKVGTRAPQPRPAPDKVYHEALMKAPPRETLMLRLAAELGLRRAEVAVVHSDDVVDDLVGHTLLVHGKGQKERMVPISPSLVMALQALPYGYAFPGDDDGHLSPRWVGKLITNLLPGDWTMHKLRHRFATRAYGVNQDSFTVQELLGHASPATTRMYVQVPREELRRTILAVAS